LSPTSVAWRVARLDDVPLVQARARRFLADLGFDDEKRSQVVLAVSEAATNTVKFAGEGEISLTWFTTPAPHVRLEAVDHGPGIGDLERARTDFISEGVDARVVSPVGRRGTGTGLGSIQRMMDATTMENQAEGGLRLIALKYLVSPKRAR
jgi:anti-sigma regulatory factor (Ser/Thr protein kinase)